MSETIKSNQYELNVNILTPLEENTVKTAPNTFYKTKIYHKN